MIRLLAPSFKLKWEIHFFYLRRDRFGDIILTLHCFSKMDDRKNDLSLKIDLFLCGGLIFEIPPKDLLHRFNFIEGVSEILNIKMMKKNSTNTMIWTISN